MGRKSKAARRKAAGIANARGFRHFESRISELIPDAEMNDTTMPETSRSPGLSDLENEANNERIILEGPRDSPLGSETEWEHQMIWWMEAYRDGKSTKDAQFDVKKNGSH